MIHNFFLDLKILSLTENVTLLKSDIAHILLRWNKKKEKRPVNAQRSGSANFKYISKCLMHIFTYDFMPVTQVLCSKLRLYYGR